MLVFNSRVGQNIVANLVANKNLLNSWNTKEYVYNPYQAFINEIVEPVVIQHFNKRGIKYDVWDTSNNRVAQRYYHQS